ncbi:MAG: glycohydrolase toxin TNT-related protein [Mycobacterium sp.]|uniref:TNT domain-containing protein n=1 Tax=Mycobacterium sp. TaxID=1785 RepID=UPI00262AD4C1|nr:glycohydrolase toxin TNT-related protein [Mycobacterium sp.]MDI3315987.1 glycohydrolase toxin TNT-related protein [Mycobacterium sp.]
MAPLAVDPAALDGAGAAVVAVGEGLVAAVGALTGGFGANTGQDAAGEVFGLQYQDAAESVLTAAAAAVNACRGTGFKVQVSASNYSRAEAASTLGGGAQVLVTPTAPGEFAAPGAPWTLGPGVPPPPLWALVQAFVGDVWPDGNPAQMHAAAACWRTFAGALHGVKDALAGPNSVVGAQRIPEGELIGRALATLGTDIAGIGAQCDRLAKGLDDFAQDVARTQDAIRDLLHRLGSVSGLVHELVEVVTGHGLEEVKKIAEDIKAVLGNLMRQAQARQQLLREGMQVLDGLVRGLQIYVRAEITHFVGEEVGNPLATVFDTYTNVGEGVLKGAAGMGESLQQLDPARFAYDPKGAAAAWEGLAKGVAETLAVGDPAFAPLLDALDPQARTTLARGLLHAEEWRADRPGLGAGENLFDIAMLGIPGLGEAGAAGEAAEAADAAGTVGRGGRALGEAGDLGRVSGAWGDIGKTSDALTRDLQNVGGNLPKSDPPAGGRPVGLPPPGPGEPPVRPGPPVESAPTPKAEPVRPPESAPAPAPAPGQPEIPVGPHERAPIDERPGPTAPGGMQEPTPVPAGEHSAPAPAAPAEQLPPSGAQFGATPRVAASPDGHPGQPTPGSAHPPQPAPMSPLHKPIPDSYPDRAHEPTLPNDSVPPGSGDGGPHRLHPGDSASPADHESPLEDGSSGDVSHMTDGGHGLSAPDPKIPGIDYPHSPADALGILEHPDAEISRLAEGGVPQHVLDGYDPLAGRTPEEFKHEFTVSGPDGKLRWDWDNQAPNNGFAGTPEESDHIPGGQHLDRVGPNEGAFMSLEGTPLAERAPAPGLASQYHVFESTGELVPADKNWVVLHGPAKDAFGQPGGGDQWVVIDRETKEPISVIKLLKEGMLQELDLPIGPWAWPK